MMLTWKLHGDGTTISEGEIVRPDERLTWPATIGLGMQHVVAMFGATFLVPLLTGFPPTTTLFFSGVGTLLFLLVTRNRLPSYLGSSFAFIAPITAAMASEGPGGALFGIVVVGVLLAAGRRPGHVHRHRLDRRPDAAGGGRRDRGPDRAQPGSRGAVQLREGPVGGPGHPARGDPVDGGAARTAGTALDLLRRRGRLRRRRARRTGGLRPRPQRGLGRAAGLLHTRRSRGRCCRPSSRWCWCWSPRTSVTCAASPTSPTRR